MGVTHCVKEKEIEKKWYLVDAEGKILGRMASQIAQVLNGKHKATFTSHIDVGDFVVVVNAGKVKVTGKKFTDKKYYTHSQSPGGLKERSFKEMSEKFPERIIEHAVKGMLPNNRLRKDRMQKLKVYKGAAHPHQAQRPIPLEI